MKSKEVKRKEAEFRKEQTNKLSPQARLDLLDQRLGRNKGASKERARLNILINNSKALEVSNA